MNQLIKIDLPHQLTLTIKREDLLHPIVSGNKFRKLKYNLHEAKEQNHSVLLTFGGAYSNHIAAVAFAGKENGFQTIGIIRGEELAGKMDDNPTLKFAKECGMQLEFVTREDYRLKNEPFYLENLRQKFGNFYLIPEGGTNALAIRGCEEILTAADGDFDFICCAVGTGGTILGLINSARANQKILGFSALKDDYIKAEIRNFAKNDHWELISDYHFGGYGKVTAGLVDFLNDFHQLTSIPLDPIYTGKMAFGIMDLIRKNYFPPGSKILLIHSGGLQGIKGMNIKLKNKKLPLINYEN